MKVLLIILAVVENSQAAWTFHPFEDMAQCEIAQAAVLEMGADTYKMKPKGEGHVGTIYTNVAARCVQVQEVEWVG